MTRATESHIHDALLACGLPHDTVVACGDSYRVAITECQGTDWSYDSVAKLAGILRTTKINFVFDEGWLGTEDTGGHLGTFRVVITGALAPE